MITPFESRMTDGCHRVRNNCVVTSEDKFVCGGFDNGIAVIAAIVMSVLGIDHNSSSMIVTTIESISFDSGY